jgi:hypothetical protein
MAAACAPYFHPRLNSNEHTGPDGAPLLSFEAIVRASLSLCRPAEQKAEGRIWEGTAKPIADGEGA